MQLRKIIICISALVIVLQGLFPPWTEVERVTHPKRRFVGYHFISGPPSGWIVEWAAKKLQFESSLGVTGEFKGANYEIDYRILLIQWFCSAILAAVAYLMLGAGGHQTVSFKEGLHMDDRLRKMLAREYLYFLKCTVIGFLLAFLTSPVIRFTVYWCSVDDFNRREYDFIGNLIDCYSKSWMLVFVPYILFQVARLFRQFIKSVRWAQKELK